MILIERTYTIGGPTPAANNMRTPIAAFLFENWPGNGAIHVCLENLGTADLTIKFGNSSDNGSTDAFSSNLLSLTTKTGSSSTVTAKAGGRYEGVLFSNQLSRAKPYVAIFLPSGLTAPRGVLGLYHFENWKISDVHGTQSAT